MSIWAILFASILLPHFFMQGQRNRILFTRRAHQFHLWRLCKRKSRRKTYFLFLSIYKWADYKTHQLGEAFEANTNSKKHMSCFVILRLRKKVQLWFLLRNVGLVFMTWDSIEVHLRLMTKGRKSRESIFSIFPTFSLHFLFLSFQCFLSSCLSFMFPSLSPSFSYSLSVQWHFCIFFNVTAASGRICCVYVIGEFPLPIIYFPPLHMFHFRNQLALCVPLLRSFYSQKTWTI